MVNCNPVIMSHHLHESKAILGDNAVGGGIFVVECRFFFIHTWMACSRYVNLVCLPACLPACVLIWIAGRLQYCVVVWSHGSPPMRVMMVEVMQWFPDRLRLPCPKQATSIDAFPLVRLLSSMGPALSDQWEIAAGLGYCRSHLCFVFSLSIKENSSHCFIGINNFHIKLKWIEVIILLKLDNLRPK